MLACYDLIENSVSLYFGHLSVYSFRRCCMAATNEPGRGVVFELWFSSLHLACLTFDNFGGVLHGCPS